MEEIEIHPNSKLHKIEGELLTVDQVSEKYHLPKTTINNRLTQGWIGKKL